jgi:ABC-2 type transport system permease protein
MTLPNLLQAEWTKFRTIRSTVSTLWLTFLVSAGLTVAIGWRMRTSFDAVSSSYRESFDPTEFSLSAAALGQILVIAFGVLLVGTEYDSGTIRPATAAVPHRARFFTAKVLLGTGLALVVSEVTTFAMYFGGQLALGSALNGSLTDPGALRAVFGTGLYLTLICVLSIGVALILRSSALALGVLIPFFFVVSTLLTTIPGLLVLAGWAVLALAAGYQTFRRRDA